MRTMKIERVNKLFIPMGILLPCLVAGLWLAGLQQPIAVLLFFPIAISFIEIYKILWPRRI